MYIVQNKEKFRTKEKIHRIDTILLDKVFAIRYIKS